ncbi:phage tail fiber protein [Rhodopseudomonas palustris]|uniref:phage tail fiber domain-containing protein n=1 Tax=Rhodopseudomonas palustris TaxID=1076 RepID=UPI0021F2E2C5|nr:phage tail fiber protein [Rhodopseudomonas palustris]UYO52494.1 hypothetical protein KQX61_18120 [Rhodopseudomonas palustris]
MASYVFYPGNGSQTDWAVPFPYLSADHVKVYSGGVAQPFAWINSALLRVTPAVPAGTVLLVKRETQKTPMTVFENTNNLTAENLTLAETQALFIAEEAADRANMSIALDEATGHFDFNSRRATNAADPVNAQDLVTKQWAETAQSAQLAQAIAARDVTISARDAAISKAADAAADAADARSSATAAATDRATVAADKATVAADRVTVANYRNDTAADRVATAADRVATGQDRAAVAADRATVAADKTTVANDKATVAADKAAAQAARVAAEAARDEAEAIVGIPTAAGTTFTPTATNPNTNVQDAVAAAVVKTGHQTLTGGFDAQSYYVVMNGGTFTPDPKNGNIQHVSNDGTHTIVPPATPCTIVLQYTNTAPVGPVGLTASGFSKVTGASYDVTAGVGHILYITRTHSWAHLHIVPVFR